MAKTAPARSARLVRGAGRPLTAALLEPSGRSPCAPICKSIRSLETILPSYRKCLNFNANSAFWRSPRPPKYPLIRGNLTVA